MGKRFCACFRTLFKYFCAKIIGATHFGVSGALITAAISVTAARLFLFLLLAVYYFASSLRLFLRELEVIHEGALYSFDMINYCALRAEASLLEEHA